MKDGCIRSSLIEFQSFLNRRIDVEAKYRVMMFLPSTVQVLCTTWYREANIFRILMPFVSGINRRKILSVSCLNSDLRGQSIIDDRMKIKRTSKVVNMLEEVALNYNIVL